MARILLQTTIVDTIDDWHVDQRAIKASRVGSQGDSS